MHVKNLSYIYDIGGRMKLCMFLDRVLLTFFIYHRSLIFIPHPQNRVSNIPHESIRYGLSPSRPVFMVVLLVSTLGPTCQYGPHRMGSVVELPHRRNVERPLPTRERLHNGEELGCACAVAEQTRHPHPERDGSTREPWGLKRERWAIRDAVAIAVPPA
jgi:hypothetical protein